MYIRRKVFSLFENEEGEARYFSTTEYVNENVEQREFGIKEESEKVWDAAKGAWVKASDFAKENGGKIKDGTMNAAGQVWNAAKGAWVKASDFAKNTISDAEAAGTKLAGKAKKIAKDVWNGNNGGRALNGRFAKVKKVGLGKVGNRAAIIATPLVAAGTVAAVKANKDKKAAEKE